MSFYIEAFDNVTSGMSKGPKIWSYGSDTDTLAVILVSGYFDGVKERIYKNDLIYVAAADGVEQLKITSENGATVTTQIFVPSSGGAPSDATYITQTPSVDLPNEQPLSVLASGILKSETGTGVISIATANVDYEVGSPALTSIAGLVTSADKMIYTTASNTYTTSDLTAAGRALLDDATAGDQRNSLGLGTIATQNSNNVLISGGSITGITDLAIADGGTAASTNTAAINNLVSNASLTTATVDAADLVLIQDSSDSNNLKSVTAQSVANLFSGGVLSVSGTTNRITSTGGSTPVIDISASYVGQSSITTLGTIGSGVWGSSATLIAPSSGGTGVANTGTFTVGGNTAFSGAFTFTGTITGNTTVTFPTSGTLQTTSGASGTVNSGTANQIGYYAGTGTAISGLTGANGSVLVTNNTGVPSMLANPAAAGRVFQSANAAIPVWSTSSYADTYAVSTLLYASASNTVTGLATTNRASLSTNSTGVPTWLALTDGQVVVGSTAGSPAAATITAGAGISVTNASNAITIASAATTPQTVSVTMTGAQFKDMYTTPIQIVAAPAAGSMHIVQSLEWMYVYGSSPFVITTSTNVVLQWGNAAAGAGTATMSAVSPNNFGGSAKVMNRAINVVHNALAKASFDGLGLFASNQTAVFNSAGTGNSVIVIVTYITVPTGL